MIYNNAFRIIRFKLNWMAENKFLNVQQNNSSERRFLTQFPFCNFKIHLFHPWRTGKRLLQKNQNFEYEREFHVRNVVLMFTENLTLRALKPTTTKDRYDPQTEHLCLSKLCMKHV